MPRRYGRGIENVYSQYEGTMGHSKTSGIRSGYGRRFQELLEEGKGEHILFNVRITFRPLQIRDKKQLLIGSACNFDAHNTECGVQSGEVAEGTNCYD